MPEPQEPKKVGIRPAGGSFMSREKVLEKIQDGKLEDLQRSQDDAQKKKAEDDEKKRIEAIDSLLPKTVNASFGTVPLDVFKSKFEIVWKQIAEKEHLARGYCSYEFEPVTGTKVQLRTLRSGEMKFLRIFAPRTDPMKDPASYLSEDILFRNIRLILGISAFAGNTFADITLPKKRLLKQEDVDAWMTDKEVAARLDWIESLPDEFTDILAGAFGDLSTAYRLALQENLKNQFAPLSLS